MNGLQVEKPNRKYVKNGQFKRVYYIFFYFWTQLIHVQIHSLVFVSIQNDDFLKANVYDQESPQSYTAD